jgi:RluA family pseudouridine synthase
VKRRSETRISAKAAGILLPDYLARRFTYLDRIGWLGEIAAGAVRVNGEPAGPDQRLAPGDHLVYQPGKVAEPPVDHRYRIVYADEYLIAVDKPGNLPCHPGGRYHENTLWAYLRPVDYNSHLGFVHRLDRETSGLVLLARRPEAARACATQFAQGTVAKRYLALVEGRFSRTPMTVEGTIGPDKDSPVRKKQRFRPGPMDEASGPARNGDRPPGRSARTRFRGLWHRNGLSLVAAEPLTGRTHQIRATLLALGHPVVGDKLYGPDDRIFLRFIADRLTAADRRRLVLNRQALHAARLTFDHPVTGERLRLRAPLPSDLKALLSGPNRETDR